MQNSQLARGSLPCTCSGFGSKPNVVALTGGPGAGKTAIMELASRSLCRHVVLIPEAASVVFGGGFPRRRDESGRKIAQRAIYFIQRELEALARIEPDVGLILCDRGTVDGAAYWPGEISEYWGAIGTTAQTELERYDSVVHLRTPTIANGYNHQNALRIESESEALALDHRIEQVWSGHPCRHFVASQASFIEKASHALAFVREKLEKAAGKHE